MNITKPLAALAVSGAVLLGGGILIGSQIQPSAPAVVAQSASTDCDPSIYDVVRNCVVNSSDLLAVAEHVGPIPTYTPVPTVEPSVAAPTASVTPSAVPTGTSTPVPTAPSGNSIDLIIAQANGNHEITLWDGIGGVAGYDWQFQGITSTNHALPTQPQVNGWYQVHRGKSQWDTPLNCRVHFQPMTVYNLVNNVWTWKGSGSPSWHQITNIQGWGNYQDDDFRTEPDGFSIGCPPVERSLHGAIGAFGVASGTTGSYTQMVAWLDGPDADRAILGMSAGGDWRGSSIDQIGMSQVIRLSRTPRAVAMLHSTQSEAQIRANPPPIQ